MAAKSSVKETENVPQVVEEQLSLIPVRDVWDNVDKIDTIGGGADLEAKMRLVGVPFVITRVTFRPGKFVVPGTELTQYYVSIEATTAPHTFLSREEILNRRRREGLSHFDPEDFPPASTEVVFNDASTGILREMVKYLAENNVITIPDGKDSGRMGESKYDVTPPEFLSGFVAATKGIQTRIVCRRGLRCSQYDADEFHPAGETFYFG